MQARRQKAQAGLIIEVLQLVAHVRRDFHLAPRSALAFLFELCGASVPWPGQPEEGKKIIGGTRNQPKRFLRPHGEVVDLIKVAEGSEAFKTRRDKIVIYIKAGFDEAKCWRCFTIAKALIEVMTGLKYEELAKHHENQSQACRWEHVEEGSKIGYIETTYQKGFYKLLAPLEESLLKNWNAAKGDFDKAVGENFGAHQVDLDEPWK